MKLTKEQTKDFLRIGTFYNGTEMIRFKEVERTFESKERWCSIFTVILLCENDGKYYAHTEYEEATESQDCSHYYERELTLDEVVPVKEMIEVTKYKPVNDGKES